LGNGLAESGTKRAGGLPYRYEQSTKSSEGFGEAGLTGGRLGQAERSPSCQPWGQESSEGVAASNLAGAQTEWGEAPYRCEQSTKSKGVAEQGLTEIGLDKQKDYPFARA